MSKHDLAIASLGVEHLERIDSKRSLYRCTCGNTFTAIRSNITTGNTRSCGCARGTHRQTKTPLYSCWQNMRQRVRDVERYPTYQGVRCDDRWATFEGFVANQPPGRNYEPGLCLCRHGDVGNYEPENCRWLTRRENCLEQKHPSGKSHCVHGHEYDEQNSALGADGRIRCRACKRLRSARHRSTVEVQS